jgi:hypothetical protein
MRHRTPDLEANREDIGPERRIKNGYRMVDVW